MLDSNRIKSLRARKSWSQEHLAEVSGLSLRTIQRIEKQGRASLESKTALAAVFEVAAGSLELSAGEARKRYVNKAAIAGVVCGALFGLLFGAVGGMLGLVQRETGSAQMAFIATSIGITGIVAGLVCGLIAFKSFRAPAGRADESQSAE